MQLVFCPCRCQCQCLCREGPAAATTTCHTRTQFTNTTVGIATLHHQFANTTVGVLLLGRAFRSGLAGDEDMPCLRSSLDAQHEASSSIVTNVIEPLEHLGARIL